MTDSEILAITEPSRELDAVAAEEVMGWGKLARYTKSHVPHYSLDIRDAFLVQARISELGLEYKWAEWMHKILPRSYTELDVYWKAGNASALQRTQAAILAVRK